MDEKKANTIEKERFLRAAGYNVIAIYACQVEAAMRANPEMNQFMETVKRNAKTLNPRAALHGGRTNAIRKTYTPKPGEEILYFDINVSQLFTEKRFPDLYTHCFQSLYPSVNGSTEGELWPIGHPKVFLHDFPDLKDIFGLVKGTFKPPKRLYHPVLGVGAKNGRYVFGLCAKCIDDQSTTHCEHSDEER